MVYNLLKVSALLVAGRFIKPRLKGLLVLILFWLLVRFLHSEYLSYVELSENTDFLIHAALLKIGLYIGGFVLYVFLVERKILLRSKKDIEKQYELERKKGSPTGHTGDDGFDFLREKRKLKTPAEKLLKKE